MDNRTVIEKLNNTNYLTWSFKMRMMLVREGLWRVIEGKTEGLKEEDISSMKEKSLSLIVLFIENDQIVLVRNAGDGVEAWNNLKQYHQKSTLSRRIRIMKMLFKMQLEIGSSMQDHLQHMFEMLSELAEMDAKL